MAKIIVAFADPKKCEQIASVLDGCGLQVFRKCATGNEVMRAFDACHDGILVCGTRFPDRTVDELAYDLGDQVLMLVLGKPDQLERCEHNALFRLPVPFTRGELSSAVNMLVQLHYMRMPRRSPEEKKLIEEAKALLIEGSGYTEQQAHQALQRMSMRLGIKMTESARRILNGESLP